MRLADATTSYKARRWIKWNYWSVFENIYKRTGTIILIIHNNHIWIIETLIGLRRYVCTGACSGMFCCDGVHVCLCVNHLLGYTIHPSLVALPVSCSGRGLTPWNACCHLSSITTCCCPILPALYCLGFILDKSRKALRFMGLGRV